MTIIEKCKALTVAMTSIKLRDDLSDIEKASFVNVLAALRAEISEAKEVLDAPQHNETWELNNILLEKIKLLNNGEKITLVKQYPSGLIQREKATFVSKLREHGFLSKQGGWIANKSRSTNNYYINPGYVFGVKMYRCSNVTTIPVDNKLIDVESGWNND